MKPLPELIHPRLFCLAPLSSLPLFFLLPFQTVSITSEIKLLVIF
jgi:hypothetical protein